MISKNRKPEPEGAEVERRQPLRGRAATRSRGSSRTAAAGRPRRRAWPRPSRSSSTRSPMAISRSCRLIGSRKSRITSPNGREVPEERPVVGDGARRRTGSRRRTSSSSSSGSGDERGDRVRRRRRRPGRTGASAWSVGLEPLGEALDLLGREGLLLHEDRRQRAAGADRRAWWPRGCGRTGRRCPGPRGRARAVAT